MVDHQSKFVLHFQDINDYVILNDTYNVVLALLQLAWKHTNMQYGDPLSIKSIVIIDVLVHQFIGTHNVKASRAKMVQRSKETATAYSMGDHVTVAVPRRLRVCLDPRRGFDRVVEVYHNMYRVR